MPIIDCQVHTYERDHPERPWIGWLHGPDEVTGDDMVVAMDEVGVDGALLVSPWSMYRYDPSYALEVYGRHPARFGLIKPFDYQAPDVAEQIGDWARHDGVVGARMMLAYETTPSADDPGVHTVLRAGAQHGLPVNILCWGHLELVGQLARANPNTQLVVDHIGLKQPFEPPAPSEPFAEIDSVLALADYDNVAIKISGACTLSHQPYPYADIWPPLTRIFKAFGFERCLWGTDWTRAVELLTYADAVNAFKVTDVLSEDERSMLMGGALTRVYGWSPSVD